MTIGSNTGRNAHQATPAGSWAPPPELVADAVRSLRSARLEGPDDRFEAAAWLALLAELGPALLTRDCRPSHITASAVVLTPDAGKTCLVLHRKLRRWVQPGGHLELGDRSIAGAAAREVAEETGLTGHVLAEPIMLARRRSACAPGLVDWHLDIRKVLVTEKSTPTLSDESSQVAWWPCDRLPEPLGEGIRQLVATGVRAVQDATASDRQ